MSALISIAVLLFLTMHVFAVDDVGVKEPYKPFHSIESIAVDDRIKELGDYMRSIIEISVCEQADSGKILLLLSAKGRALLDIHFSVEYNGDIIFPNSAITSDVYAGEKKIICIDTKRNAINGELKVDNIKITGFYAVPK